MRNCHVVSLGPYVSHTFPSIIPTLFTIFLLLYGLQSGFVAVVRDG